MSTALHGINGYIKRLEAIAEQCGEKKAGNAEAQQIKDEFTRMKLRMYLLLEEIREGVHERQALMKRRGVCTETIQKNVDNRQKYDELKRTLPQLQQVHKKAMGKRSAERNKEELQNRFRDIRVLKQHVDEVHELIEGGNLEQAPSLPDGPAAALFGNSLRETARGEMNRNLTDEEKEELAKMRGRDAEIDKQVGEIGMVVERMKPVAEQIGATAKLQKEKADATSAAVDKNTEEIKKQNEFVKEIIKYEKNTQCCCQMVLGIVFLCVIGFVFHQLKLG
jgi:hypothetical protein